MHHCRSRYDNDCDSHSALQVLSTCYAWYLSKLSFYGADSSKAKSRATSSCKAVTYEKHLNDHDDDEGAKPKKSGAPKKLSDTDVNFITAMRCATGQASSLPECKRTAISAKQVYV
uniref:Uncharacterized protein n=1 Tax=Lygus hesperus TaxID=30085 RepID=A0A146MAX3_LYGHE